MKSILDPTFHYTPAANTDIRKTFARARKEMKKAAEKEAAELADKINYINQQPRRNHG